LNNLQSAITSVTANTLVVAVGGLAAALAADGTTVPYIALTGADFKPASTNFLGGISMNTAKHHPDQLMYLRQKQNPKRLLRTCLLNNSANTSFLGGDSNIFS